MPGKPLPRPITFHIPLSNVTVKRSWDVAGVTFRPAGWLTSHAERSLNRAKRARDVPLETVEFLMYGVRSVGARAERWATAQVTARHPEEARTKVRDAVALLRLFQRGRTRLKLDSQTFGLPIDVYASREDYVVTPRGQVPRAGFQWEGIVASWDFDRRQMDSFAEDPRIRWIEAAITSPTRDDLQNRVLTCLRFVNLATILVAPPIRVALRALALEALFTDDLPPRRDLRHRIARRYAYLTCGRKNRWAPPSVEGDRHRWPERPACLFLEAVAYSALGDERRRLKSLRVPVMCSWYDESWRLFEDRDEVMHQARSDFSDHDLGWHEINLDVAILAVAEWADASHAGELGHLDNEIEAFVVRGVQDAETGELRAPQWRSSPSRSSHDEAPPAV